MRSIPARSGPNTLIPIGVRIPVESMSIRARIGIVQELATPGIFTALSSSSTSFSGVIPGRHSDSGFRFTTVSNISSGAGSVAVFARPALPKTDSTSGNDLMMRSCCCITSAALVTLIPGNAAGINSNVPSCNVGINSLPICLSGIQVTASITTANRMVVFLKRSTSEIKGL